MKLSEELVFGLFFLLFGTIAIVVSSLNLLLSVARKSSIYWKVYRAIGILIGIFFLLLGIIYIIVDLVNRLY